MTAQRSIHTAQVERAYKEVLYRFMGEVHATKAALYLKQPGDAWTMATQYGFGRRDPLAETLADDHTIVRMVRAFGEDPRYYNDPNELGELEGYLAEAGTSRLMLVPLTGRSGLIGFVDVRDKGAQRPFAAGKVFHVHRDLDLVEVACAMQRDDIEQVKTWTDAARLSRVADERARTWLERETRLWAVVVKPWVLVQEVD